MMIRVVIMSLVMGYIAIPIYGMESSPISSLSQLIIKKLYEQPIICPRLFEICRANEMIKREMSGFIYNKPLTFVAFQNYKGFLIYLLTESRLSSQDRFLLYQKSKKIDLTCNIEKKKWKLFQFNDQNMNKYLEFNEVPSHPSLCATDVGNTKEIAVVEGPIIYLLNDNLNIVDRAQSAEGSPIKCLALSNKAKRRLFLGYENGTVELCQSLLEPRSFTLSNTSILDIVYSKGIYPSDDCLAIHYKESNGRKKVGVLVIDQHHSQDWFLKERIILIDDKDEFEEIEKVESNRQGHLKVFHGALEVRFWKYHQTQPRKYEMQLIQ